MKSKIFKSSIAMIVLLFLSFPSSSGGGGGGKKDTGGGGGTSCSVSTQNAPVILTFPSTYNGRIFAVIPENFSDPDLVDGGTSLFNSSSTFYCVVTVVGVSCSNYSRTYVWDVRSREKSIPIPTDTDFNLSVEFYESCGLWDNNSIGAGRPFYAFSRYYVSYQANFFAELRYVRTERC
jgi:hypothetical protein